MKREGEVFEEMMTIGNQLGLHARVATMMVQSMRNFSCRVAVIKDGVEVDAKSILGLLLLAATPGSQILVRATGPDSIKAIEEIRRLIQYQEPDTN